MWRQGKKCFGIGRKLILDLSKQPHELKIYQSLFIKNWRGTDFFLHSDNREKSCTLLNTLDFFGGEGKFVKLYVSYTMHAIFILLYLCCVCGVEICVCLIFVNSFHKNSLVAQQNRGWWKLTTEHAANKKQSRELWIYDQKHKEKICCVGKITLGLVGSNRHKHGATNKQITKRVTKLKCTPEMRSLSGSSSSKGLDWCR